jgi:hypothetical protein
MTSKPQLKGWVSFWRGTDGELLMSDSYPTKAQCQARYKTAPVTGFINLSLIPADAIHVTKAEG